MKLRQELKGYDQVRRDEMRERKRLADAELWVAQRKRDAAARPGVRG
jgi:hypothetical protein